MVPLIHSGNLCTVEPVSPEEIKKGDIVLCVVNGHQYLHLVKAIQPNRVLIGNNKGGVNGWTSSTKVYGRLLKIEP